MAHGTARDVADNPTLSGSPPPSHIPPEGGSGTRKASVAPVQYRREKVTEGIDIMAAFIRTPWRAAAAAECLAGATCPLRLAYRRTPLPNRPIQPTACGEHFGDRRLPERFELHTVAVGWSTIASALAA